MRLEQALDSMYAVAGNDDDDNNYKLRGEYLHTIQHYVIFMWDIPVCGEYKPVQITVNHTQ